METRSQRQQAQRPPYPQVSTSTTTAVPCESSASSAFNSSSSLASVQTPGSTIPTHQTMASFGGQAAPLPSPLAGQSNTYFGSINASTATQQMQTQSATYVGQRGGNGGAPETAPFLDNFNLVAEAAKRAQMACLMRDLGDVEL